MTNFTHPAERNHFPRKLESSVSLSDNVSETTTPVKFTVEGDGVVSHVSFYQS